jgi:hypothetical protein
MANLAKQLLDDLLGKLELLKAVVEPKGHQKVDELKAQAITLAVAAKDDAEKVVADEKPVVVEVKDDVKALADEAVADVKKDV